MTHAQNPADGMSVPRPFLAVVWAALLTALLSALLPVGLPHSTAVGSAFNPATTSVALKVGTHRPLITAETLTNGDDEAGSDIVVPLPATSFLPAPDVAGLPPRISAAPLPPDRSATPSLSGRIVSAAYPRGPPFA
ncbi:hypothetical protein U1769_22845 [Sphingomonas sp. ZT3P38]|uniref:hypothetical protein n=1 Tax=Parasphingomonas zepuensis TaxID=3096161 RepID=UPI002FC91AEA